MPVFIKDKKKVLFVHIPKCGGSSVEDLVKKNEIDHYFLFTGREARNNGFTSSPQHLTFKQLQYVLGEDFTKNVASVAVVRDPISRLVSEYKWSNRNRKHLPPFEGWVKGTFDGFKYNPFINDNHIRPQSDFIGSDTVVFKLEDNGVEEAYQFMCKELGLASEQMTFYRKKSKEVLVDVSDEVIKMCNDFYRVDYERLGYSCLKENI